MIISVVNHTNGKLSDEDVQRAVRAINTQIADDFEPYWSMGARLRLEGKAGKKPPPPKAIDLRGDAVLYLWDKTDVDATLGYHDANNRGLPFGFVFTELAERLGESWTTTFSHEALELVADPEANLMVKGPNPHDPRKEVFFWYEMSDAVQDESYDVAGIRVSNFVLPLYFTSSDEMNGRNDFLGHAHDGKTLQSFGVNPGGYLGYFDPETGKHETYTREGDRRAAERMQIKSRALKARRASRYQRRRGTS